MKIKVSKTTKTQLNWLVAKCLEYECSTPSWTGSSFTALINGSEVFFSPTENWSQGGPIIEQENIALYPHGDNSYEAEVFLKPVRHHGPTPLIAAMRCYVASKLGEEVDAPDELGEQA